VTDASHYVVFAAKSSVTEADVDAYLARTVQVRGVTLESMDSYRKMIVGNVVHGMEPDVRQHWTALQTYIALGNFMTSAAVLGIDTCPMEGLDPSRYDEILGLPAQGYRTCCACAAGYRAATDKYAAAPKVRFAAADVVRHV
jgi:nitroreductase